jgi:thymidine phosphorylase
VTLALGDEMLVIAGLAPDAAAARAKLDAAIRSGAALERLSQLVAAQGGDAAMVEHPDRLPSAPVRHDVLAERDGVVAHAEPRALGRVIIELGGGRRMVTDTVRPDVGLEVPVKPGQRVSRGDLLARVHARDHADAERVTPAIRDAIPVADDAESVLPLLAWRVTASGATSLGA